MNAAGYYRTRIISSLAEIGRMDWDALVLTQPDATPFLSFTFLHALHESGSAAKDTGWEPQYLTLWQDDLLKAVLPLYLKYIPTENTCSTGPRLRLTNVTSCRTIPNCCRRFLSHRLAAVVCWPMMPPHDKHSFRR